MRQESTTQFNVRITTAGYVIRMQSTPWVEKALNRLPLFLGKCFHNDQRKQPQLRKQLYYKQCKNNFNFYYLLAVSIKLRKKKKKEMATTELGSQFNNLNK